MDSTRAVLLLGTLLVSAASLLGCSSDSSEQGVGCGSSSPEALAACVDADRYRTDVALVTGERPADSEHWQAVQDHCKDTLSELGFSVELEDYGTGTNVVGTLAGKTKPSERVLVGAHYDHIPGCPGADDNATGTAGVLELARVLASSSFERTLVVVCFDEEELGRRGSIAYAERALTNGENLVNVTILDMIGFIDLAPNTQTVPPGLGLVFQDEYAALKKNEFRADFILLAHDEKSSASATAFTKHAGKIGLNAMRLQLPSDLMAVDELQRSDHGPFWERGYPAMFVGDSAELRYPAYHCQNGDDVIENLSFDFATQTMRATVAAVATDLGVSR
jgi:Zn-dependent M28 family amino/carboxypeptidase